MSAAPHLVIVTGMSGAGRATALRTLEDLGFDTIDNLPLRLLGRVSAAPDDRPLALGLGSATRDFDARAVLDFARTHPDAELLFLDCTDAELEHRYSATRARHPLAADRPAAAGIARDRSLLGLLRDMADHVIDTTGLTTNALQAELRLRFAPGGSVQGATTVTIQSFAFSRGVPRAADLVFDMRFLRNPHWEPALRPLTGRDSGVADHIATDPAYAEAMERIEGLLALLLPRYVVEGKSYVTVAFGCTGGRHRSVHAAERVATRLREAGFSPTVVHRDLRDANGPERARAEQDAGGH